MSVPSAGRKWIPVAAAAEYLSLPKKTLYSLAARGRLPARSIMKLGRQIRICLEVLEDELAGPKGRPAAARGRAPRA